MNKNTFSVSILILAILACGLPAPTETAPVLPIIVETFELKSSPFSEESQAPIYKITAEIPSLEPATQPNVQAFNTRLKAVVEGEIQAFKGGMAEMLSEPDSTGSSFNILYELIGQRGSFWSIRFNIDGYSEGAAHPYHYSVTMNYDLATGTDVTLDNVFLPDTNYLQVISDYAKIELTSRAIGFEGFMQGAEPTPQNYKNWNISDAGFIVTFDEGQVAAYAAGSQVVVIPFGALTEVINVEGPLKLYLP